MKNGRFFSFSLLHVVLGGAFLFFAQGAVAQEERYNNFGSFVYEKTGQPFLAVHEIKRDLFNATIDTNACLLQIANTWFCAQKYDSAAEYSEKLIDRAASQDLVVKEALKIKCRAYLAQRKYSLLYQDAQELRNRSDCHIDDSLELVFLFAVACAQRFQIDSSKAILDSLKSNVSYTDKCTKLDSLFVSYRQHSFKHPMIARALSGRIPGAGHWYAGQKGKGVMAASIMALSCSAIGYLGYRWYTGDTHDRWVFGMDIAILWTALIHRYWQGIEKGAFEEAVNANARFQEEYLEDLIKIRGF